MRLVARLKTIEEISILSQLGVDVFLVDTIFTTKKITEYNLNDLDKVAEMIHAENKKVYFLINKMIHEYDLIDLNKLFSELSKLKIDGIIINDLTVYAFAKDYNLEKKIIYQPGTYNTNSFDMMYFDNLNVKGITLSREITLTEIKEIAAKSHKIELSIIGHGYLDMFYSKRKLLSSYAIYKNIDGKTLINNYGLTLEEEIRKNDRYPILEDFAGTHIFRSKKLKSFAEISDFESIFSDFILERLFIEDEEYYEAIKAYKQNNLAIDFLQRYNKDYDSGFYYKYTEKLKGELDES